MSQRQPWTRVTSTVVSLPVDNVDTDQIVPARFLTVTDRAGLEDVLFHDQRQDPAFPLNEARAKRAKVLVAGDNFGCGSSREHAPWALVAWGFRAVVAPSFADIFQANALKNGLVPAAIGIDAVEALHAARAGDEAVTVTVDLDAQTVTGPDGVAHGFTVDPFQRHLLLGGLDELGYLLEQAADIAAFEAATETAAETSAAPDEASP